jgi:type IV fimbrial biogenesis protein FimT
MLIKRKSEVVGSQQYRWRLLALRLKPACRTAKRYSAGVTLIELMVTVAIAAILISIAVPSFESIVRRNRIAAATNLLVQSLHLARSEAVRRGRDVVACPSESVNDAAPKCDSSAVWTDGWVIYSDENSDGNYNTGDILIRVGQINNQSLTIAPGQFISGIKFLATGAAKKTDGSSVNNNTFRLCIPKVNPREIIMNMVGRIRLDIVKEEICP